MKKLVLVLTLLAMSSAVYSYCFWQKISETNGMNGQKICQWKCGYGSDARYTTTSGYGFCPNP